MQSESSSIIGAPYRVRFFCPTPTCKAKMERDALAPLPLGFSCKRCGTGVPLRGQGIIDQKLNNCVICNYPFFYVEKAFPKALRFIFMGLAIGLSFFTYGISLIVFAGLDWLLFQRLPWMRVCYFCQSEYHGLPHDPELKPFDPHKGVAYDARRDSPSSGYEPIQRIPSENSGN